MINKTFLILAFLVFSGFSFFTNPVSHNESSQGEVEVGQTIYAGLNPAPYCAGLGVTKEGSSAELKKLYRKYKRQCKSKYAKKVAIDPTLKRRKFLKECLNKKFQKKDEDCDGIVTTKRGNSLDNCPTVSNSAQGDDDMDDIGDACEGGVSSLTIN